MEHYKINNYSNIPSLQIESSFISGKESILEISKDNTNFINKSQLSINSESNNIGVSLAQPTVGTNFLWNFDVFNQTNSIQNLSNINNTNEFTDTLSSSLQTLTTEQGTTNFYDTSSFGLSQLNIASHLTKNYNPYNYIEETSNYFLPFYHSTIRNSTLITPVQMDSYPLTPQSNNRQPKSVGKEKR
ncbi:Hypothetical protein SRAE_X000094700 [Strongyloides ratti]|uniref:Uncharacterized protein n=1 Tax=Strongyloides ratti TaxID=34506 RepID=A0A090LVD3_STRRB|nr:Hypothetical protein SRAE_X000094700 [Strongyloides ratti]CEF71624.1 Hypothetical protein SRAE_X000094700 [Strongyloides ratti]